MAVDLDTGILAPMVVFFAGAAAIAGAKAYLLLKDKNALKRRVGQLAKELAASEEHRKEHLNLALDRYRDEVERQQKQFDVAKMSHEEIKKFAGMLLEFIERKHPGWLQDRLDGKPEYELVFTPTPPKRPEPKPRQPGAEIPPQA